MLAKCSRANREVISATTCRSFVGLPIYRAITPTSSTYLHYNFVVNREIQHPKKNCLRGRELFFSNKKHTILCFFGVYKIIRMRSEGWKKETTRRSLIHSISLRGRCFTLHPEEVFFLVSATIAVSHRRFCVEISAKSNWTGAIESQLKEIIRRSSALSRVA